MYETFVQLSYHAAAESASQYLNKHIVQHMQPCHHAAAESNKHEYVTGPAKIGHVG